jgi:hypothetical protein
MAHVRFPFIYCVQGFFFYLLCSYTFGLIHSSWYLQKFSNIEWADMPICNLAKTVDNIWLQKSRKCGTSLYIATCDDYIRAFK